MTCASRGPGTKPCAVRLVAHLGNVPAIEALGIERLRNRAEWRSRHRLHAVPVVRRSFRRIRGNGSDVTTKRLLPGAAPVGKLSISIASPPGWSILSPHVRPRDPGRVDENSSHFPSGDQRGLELSYPGAVYLVDVPPALGTTQTSWCRLLSASLTVVTVNATRRPSGESAGALRVVTRYQSAGVNARGPWAEIEQSGAASATNAIILRMCACSNEAGESVDQIGPALLRSSSPASAGGRS